MYVHIHILKRLHFQLYSYDQVLEFRNSATHSSQKYPFLSLAMRNTICRNHAAGNALNPNSSSPSSTVHCWLRQRQIAFASESTARRGRCWPGPMALSGS